LQLPPVILVPPRDTGTWGIRIYALAPPAQQIFTAYHVWCIPVSCVICKENNKGEPSHPPPPRRVVVVFCAYHTGSRYAPNMGMRQNNCCHGGADFGQWCVYILISQVPPPPRYWYPHSRITRSFRVLVLVRALVLVLER
jgi:hypothetical protein